MQDPPKGSTATPLRPGGRTFVLRFISGKYQGGEFPISPDKPIVVGRSSDLDMVLVEDMVSRKHARIAMQTGEVWIEDLGSTNGTFVNGEKIKRAKLKEGDRVLIGTSILKLIASDVASDPKNTTEARKNLENVAEARRTMAGRSMSGSLEEIPLPDLLQLFGTSKKTGVLVLGAGDDVGKIFLRKGNIYFASINDVKDLPPMKSVFRMLTWMEGTFDLEPPDERTHANEIDLSVQEVLMEGLRQLDEFNEMKDKLPELHAKLSLVSPLENRHLRDLSPEELDVVELSLTLDSVEAVLNHSKATDLDTVQVLQKLLKEKILKATE